MKVFILTEGGKGIGFGHITRCSALYEAFEEKCIRPYFIANTDNSVKALLKGKKAKIFNWLRKQAELLYLISGADVVIIDSYLAGYNLYRKIAGQAKLAVYIDDNKRLNYPRGIVINGSIFAEKLDYPPKEGATYLLGVKYMPLQKEFWSIPRGKIKRNIANILVTFGGSDSKNMTLKVLRFLADAYPELNKLVIIGRGFKNIKEVERSKDGKTDLIYYPSAIDVKEAMLRADIAVSAGGQTLYELARIGLPSIGICLADNQNANLAGWQKAGFIENIGGYKDVDLALKLRMGVERLFTYQERIKRSRIGSSLVDGKGADRIVDLIKKRI